MSIHDNSPTLTDVQIAYESTRKHRKLNLIAMCVFTSITLTICFYATSVGQRNAMIADLIFLTSIGVLLLNVIKDRAPIEKTVEIGVTDYQWVSPGAAEIIRSDITQYGHVRYGTLRDAIEIEKKIVFSVLERTNS